MGTSDSYGGHDHDEVSVLVRSLALSTAKLWEELFERMDRLESAQRDLRTLVSRIERALPEDAASLRAALVALEEPVAPDTPAPTRGEGSEAPEGSQPATGAPEVSRRAAAPMESLASAPDPGPARTEATGETGGADSTRSLPPVWTPTPLARVPPTGLLAAGLHSAPTEELPSLDAADALGALTVAPPAPRPGPLVVPPPPAGYVVFRVPSRPEEVSITSGTAGPGVTCAAILDARAPARVVEGLRPPASMPHDEDRDGDASGPAIAPNFSARAGRRRR